MNGRIEAGYLQKFLPNHLATSKHNVESYILTARLLRLVMTIYLNEQVYRNHSETCQVEAVVDQHLPFFVWLKNSFEQQDNQTLELLWSLIRDRSCEFAKSEELLSAIERVRIAYIDIGDPEPSDFIFSIFKNHGGIKTYGKIYFYISLYRINNLFSSCLHLMSILNSFSVLFHLRID